jgi:hypothetical protein
VYLEALADEEIRELAEGAEHPLERVIEVTGGHPWLLSELCVLLRRGVSLEDAEDRLYEKCAHSFPVWRRQLGEDGLRLLSELYRQPIAKAEFLARGARARMRPVLLRCRYMGLVRMELGMWVGAAGIARPELLHTSGGGGSAPSTAYDLAISYAREDESLARSIRSQLGEFSVFFDLDLEAALWGQPLSMTLPAIFEDSARYVLVLSTPDYVRKHWTRVEFDAACKGIQGRVLMIDLGEIPSDLPESVLYLKGPADVLVRLVDTIRKKLIENR